MTMRQFIRKNRSEIDAAIRGECDNLGKLNDAEREMWILNDEGLYLWARDNKVTLGGELI